MEWIAQPFDEMSSAKLTDPRCSAAFEGCASRTTQQHGPLCDRVCVLRPPGPSPDETSREWAGGFFGAPMQPARRRSCCVLRSRTGRAFHRVSRAGPAPHLPRSKLQNVVSRPRSTFAFRCHSDMGGGFRDGVSRPRDWTSVGHGPRRVGLVSRRIPLRARSV